MRLAGLKFGLPKIFQRERRRSERQRVHESLYLDYKSQDPPLQGSAEASDLSLTGIRFKSGQTIPKQTLLDLTLRFAAGVVSTETLSVQARVVRCVKPLFRQHVRVGCVFVALTQDSEKILEAFLCWLKERKEKYLFFRYGDEEGYLR